MREYLSRIEAGTAPRIKQAKSKVTRFRRRSPEDGIIDWHKSATELYNWVRALTHPYPGAFTYYNENKLYIWEAGLSDIDTTNMKPGQIVDIAETGFIGATGTEGLIIKRVQIENDEEMQGERFAKKYKLQEGQNLGASK